VRPLSLLDLGTGAETRLVIAGKPGRGSAILDDKAPASGELLARVQAAGNEDVALAVEAARQAQPGWAGAGVRERASAVHELAGRLEEQAERIAFIDAKDTGSPLGAMRSDVFKGASMLHLYAGVGLEMQGRTIPASPSGLHLTIPEPWGVVGAITAYNHPILFACLRAGPVLMAGNTLLLKPAEQAPLSSIALAALAEDVLPPGVLTVLPGGADTGRALVNHPEVYRLSFTGSFASGLDVQRVAAESGSIKSLTLELGGKNPILVFPDTDLIEAAAGVVRGMNFTRVQGQSCGSTSRLLVHRSVHQDVVDEVVRISSAIRVGLPEDEDSEMGSLISFAHRDRVTRFIEEAKTAGAELLTGGGPPTDRADLDGGAFLSPTVFDRVDEGSRLAGDEIFGPVLAVMDWEDEEHAVRMANATQYGLTASVWTRDIDCALRVARRLDAGYVWINDVETRYPGVPFGGWKHSGVGTEQGLSEEILSFTRNKSLNVRVRGR
jgi:acyl-CoA reductase-like NAD-dependent aldehyde dehydrogenase